MTITRRIITFVAAAFVGAYIGWWILAEAQADSERKAREEVCEMMYGDGQYIGETGC